MAKTLQDILGSPITIKLAASAAAGRPANQYRPVHQLENVDGDSTRVRTICRSVEWTVPGGWLLDPNDPNATKYHAVDCLGCIEVRDRVATEVRP